MMSRVCSLQKPRKKSVANILVDGKGHIESDMLIIDKGASEAPVPCLIREEEEQIVKSEKKVNMDLSPAMKKEAVDLGFCDGALE
ncbi:hypothetical protein L1987_43029 [Smallanthus sonchifolius]|uniref:Uncharacterized protein n=1 Tax=Smallanthus sonchifolius TaxID=185202 RepID=A0ACB9GKA8_9ASTR|nr:hypothetical protein L1987_43029 [Smallanthus sonchifolius]